jgi:hypothetical protein
MECGPAYTLARAARVVGDGVDNGDQLGLVPALGPHRAHAILLQRPPRARTRARGAVPRAHRARCKGGRLGGRT